MPPQEFSVDDAEHHDERPRAVLSEKTLYAAEKYTQIKLAMELAGGMTPADWEHARSYAVEAVFSLLMDNPETFRLARDMRKILDARKRP